MNNLVNSFRKNLVDRIKEKYLPNGDLELSLDIYVNEEGVSSEYKPEVRYIMS